MAKDEAPLVDRRRSDDEPWYNDRRIPLGLIFAFVFQGSVIVWDAATKNAKLDDHDRRITVQEDFQKNAILGPNGFIERMTRLEEQQKGEQKSLDRIEAILASPSNGSGARK